MVMKLFTVLKRVLCVGCLPRMLLIFAVASLLRGSHSARNRGRHYASKGCEFPSRWAGKWFQKGVHPPISIEKDIFSFKGKCHDANGHMFFIEDPKEKCFRCVVIYEKHPNVLQYRETYCDGYNSLKQACSVLSGDAALYSLFRMDAEPMSCQLRGPFVFSYSRGGSGECKNPVSTLDSCTDSSRLLFRFQACADVISTESSVEELSCLALWKEGSAHYLVGKMTYKNRHSVPFNDENAYRCFMFEFLPEKGEIQMSQNADATCDGLVSPWEGSRTMKLVKRKHPISSCQFPAWVTNPHRWHSLDGKRTYIFSHKNSSFTMMNSKREQSVTKFICIAEIDETVNSTLFITHGLIGCESGYVCIKFYRRHRHVIEIRMGQFSRSPQEACHSSFIDHQGEELITLVAPSPETHACPTLSETNGLRVQLGKAGWFRREMCEDPDASIVGCQARDTMRFLVTCASYTDVKSFHCHGHWEENGRSYIVTSLKDKKYCFVYRDAERTTHVSGIHDTCRRSIEPGMTGNFTFNISSAGECDGLLNKAVSLRLYTWTYIVVVALTLFVCR